MLYVDIPTRPELMALTASRGPAHVSFYVPTTPETQHIETARIELGNLLRQAEAQLEAAGTPKRTIWPISEQVNDLLDDDGFWTHQANGLAVLVTPDHLSSFRLPTRLEAMVQVADRFHLKPILRAVSVPLHGFVLALEENAVRLVEVFADMPAQEVRVPGMPTDAASAVGTANVNSRSYSGRKGGAEGQKVLLRQYARQIDAALRPVLSGRSEPLILAAAAPLDAIYRSVNSHPELTEAGIATSPARMTPAELGAEARKIMDALHRDRLAALAALFKTRGNEGRASTDIAQTARAATFGAVDTLIVDIDSVVPGTLADTDGAVTFADAASAETYGVVDEIAGRVLAAGGQVLGVRRDEVPGGGDLAAILRFAV